MSLSASAVQGEQLYDPYGSHRYAEGTPGTDKGYTGQFIDAATGLAYDHARSYLRHIGVFLSPDHVQGNAQGMDPYSYMGAIRKRRRTRRDTGLCASQAILIVPRNMVEVGVGEVVLLLIPIITPS